LGTLIQNNQADSLARPRFPLGKALASSPEAKARFGSAARWDLCGELWQLASLPRLITGWYKRSKKD